MEILSESLQTEDLTLINNLTAREFAADEVYIFSAKFIDDSPTSNGRIWSQDWQRENVDQFIGLPVLVEHEHDQSVVLGRIYKAEQKGNAIHGKVYVPLTTEVGRSAKEKIEAGLFKNVSIMGKTHNQKPDGKNVRILPHKDDRVFEVSFTAVPGCKGCGVTKEHQSPCSGDINASESDKGDIVPAQPDPWLAEARSAHQAMTAEYVRLAAFVHGTSINKESYRAVAESCDPATLRAITADLKRTYDERGYAAESVNTDDVTDAIRNLRKMKGV